MVDRRQGWWAIGFAVLLLIGGGMVSVPTADDPSANIVTFYAAHGSVVVAAQVIGVLALVPLLLFATALARRAPDGPSSRRIVGATIAVAVTELATTVPPLVLALGTPTLSTAHSWTVAADLTDAALFVALGLFALATMPRRPTWARWVGIAVAALAFVRAVASPLGFTVLDAVAPIAFLAYVVALGILMLREPPVEAVAR